MTPSKVTRNIVKHPDFERVLIEDGKTYYVVNGQQYALPFHVQLKPHLMLARWLNHHCNGWYHLISRERGCVLFELIADAYQARVAHGVKP